MDGWLNGWIVGCSGGWMVGWLGDWVVTVRTVEALKTRKLCVY